jgi:hypothetical protein
MTCRDIDELMSSTPGNPMWTPEAIEHLAKCAQCRVLMSMRCEDEMQAAPPQTQLRRIQARIAGNLKPVRPLAPSRIFLLGCAIIFFCIVGIGVMPFGMSGWSALSILQKTAIFMTLATGAGLLAVSTVGQMVPGSKYTLAPATLPIGILAVLVIVFAAVFRPREETAFVISGLACMKNGLTYSIPAGFLFWLMVRRGAILYPKLMGAAIGGLAGLTGLSVLEMNCSNLNVFHILVWHWGVVLLSSVAGALLGVGVEYIQRLRSQKASRGSEHF